MRPIQGMVNRAVQFAQSPLVLRNVAQVMREVAPVVRVGNAVFVFRYNDVLDTLAADADFGVTPIYATNMDRVTGDFFLGMENGPRYHKEESFSKRAYRGQDVQRVRVLVSETARDLVDQARRQGRMEFVSHFANAIPLMLLDQYFGVPGPSPTVMQRWMSVVFWELFLNFGIDRKVTQDAINAGQEMQPYLRQRIAEIRAKGGEDTFLGRLVELQQEPNSDLSEDAIVRNIGGVIVGAVATQAKAMTLVLQELLRRPEILAQARRAARDGDDELLSGYIFEALRFNPHNPLLVRHAMRPTVVAPRTIHAKSVTTGTPIIAMLISASFDAKGFANPEVFNPRRQYDQYLHFGYGMHRCFGAHLVKIVLTAALREVLCLEGLTSVGPAAQAVGYTGPFPSSFKIQFQPGASSGPLSPAAIQA